jgi:tetratricopeptide (TPR) repeat protein
MRILPLLIILAVAGVTLADSIVLKDGTRLEGTIKRTESGWQITAPDGTVTTVPFGNVKSIELGSRGTESNGVALASLRRSVDALTDLDQIIERYERFIANSNDAGVTEEAKVDLATWQDRRAKGLVKQGSNWVTRAEAVRLIDQAVSGAATARDLLREGRVPEAESQIQQVLDLDPANAAALYLRGVMLYRQDKLSDARKAFESVNSAVQNHAPTLNNLAVILWRQNATGGALSSYDQAMQAQPVNKFILDNVAEALGGISEDQRKGQAIQRVMRRQ